MYRNGVDAYWITFGGHAVVTPDEGLPVGTFAGAHAERRR